MDSAEEMKEISGGQQHNYNRADKHWNNTVPASDSSTDPPADQERVRVLEKQSQKRIFKIIVIGDSNVGKTCLTYRFCSGKFPDKTEATIGVDFREKQLEVDGENLKVSISSISSNKYTNSSVDI